MRKLDSSDLKDLALLKHYRIIRKWVCKTCNIKEADLELLMYLDSLNLFTKQDFKTGYYRFWSAVQLNIANINNISETIVFLHRNL